MLPKSWSLNVICCKLNESSVSVVSVVSEVWCVEIFFPLFHLTLCWVVRLSLLITLLNPFISVRHGNGWRMGKGENPLSLYSQEEGNREGSECPGERKELSRCRFTQAVASRGDAQEAAAAPQYQVMESPSADASRTLLLSLPPILCPFLRSKKTWL